MKWEDFVNILTGLITGQRLLKNSQACQRLNKQSKGQGNEQENQEIRQREQSKKRKREKEREKQRTTYTT